MVMAMVFLLCAGGPAIPANAANFGENNAQPSVIDVEWARPEQFLRLEKGENECVFYFQVNGKEVPLTLTFPSLGGVRLHAEQTGYFTPESLLPITYEENGDSLALSQENVRVVFCGGADWRFELQNAAGETVHTLNASSIRFGYQGKKLKKVMLEGPIGEDEALFGLGERFNSFDQVGQSVLLWNFDSYRELMSYNGDKTVGYKNVPILYSSRGYTLFFNSTYAATADIGSTDKRLYSLDFNGPKLDVYFWLGTPQENLQSYTALTGRTVIPPKWALEYSVGAGGQVWNALGQGKHMDVMNKVMDEYARLGTPVISLFGEQAPQYDAQAYQLLKNNNAKMIAWYWSAMGVGDMYKYCPSLTPDTLPKVVVDSDPSRIMQGEYIDFSNPNGAKVISGFFSKLWKWGLRGCMVDFGDNIFEDSRFYNGMTGDEMHNFYAYLYNKGYHDAWSEALGSDYILFSRSGCAGSQSWVGQFAGDHPSTFQGLQQAILGGLSASTAGFSLWGSDIGGYGFDDYPPTPDCYMRWMQFGTFSPLMRTHGTSDRNPWTYGAQAEEVFTSHYWLRENLLDTIYGGAVRASKTGISMIQPLYLAYPDQKALIGVQDQYLFCGAFLVCPVVTEETYEREVVFPAGNDWIDLWTGEVVRGGQTLTVAAPQERIPVYVKAGAALPIQLASATLRLTDSMKSGRCDALLVAAGAGETLHYVDEAVTETYRVEQTENGMVIHNAEGADRRAVLVYGVNAENVLVDGRKLALSGEGDEGFTTDGGCTTVRLASGDWKTITVSGAGVPAPAENDSHLGAVIAGAAAGLLAVGGAVFALLRKKRRGGKENGEV